MNGFAPDAIRADDFLGGALTLWQPVAGYRAGVDPILLAATVPARPGDRVLELGCGAGTAVLALGRRVTGLGLVGVERQPAYAELATRNARDNAIALDVVCADLAHLPEPVRSATFDHVLMNPPYFQRPPDSPAASPDPGREAALAEETALETWIDIGTRRLKPRGYLTLIQRAERLPDVLAAMQGRLGSVVVKPICPRVGRAATLVLVQARKGGRGAFRLAAPAGPARRRRTPEGR